MGVQMGASVSIASATVTHGHTETRACRGIYFVAKKMQIAIILLQTKG